VSFLITIPILTTKAPSRQEVGKVAKEPGALSICLVVIYRVLRKYPIQNLIFEGDSLDSSSGNYARSSKFPSGTQLLQRRVLYQQKEQAKIQTAVPRKLS
jgi:hypothetical protein